MRDRLHRGNKKKHQKSWSEHDNPTKDSDQQGIQTNILTMFLPGKFYATPLKGPIFVKI